MNHRTIILVIAVCLGLSLATPAQNTQKLTDQQVHHLALLGQLWGFLKYYHPQVNKGKFDWDEQLFRKIPLVRDAKDDAALSRIFLDWIDSLGNVPVCRKCDDLPKDLITYNLDERWMHDKSFSKDLQEKIIYIKNNRHMGPGAYVRYAYGSIEFLKEKELNFPEMKFPPEQYRLHFLFRYWNSINYFFPYKNLIGKDWPQVLHQFVPQFISATDTLQYQTAIVKLIHSINDTHTMGENKYVQEEYGAMGLPVRLKIINDEAVVLGYYNEELGKKSGLERGDVIEKVNGRTVKEIIDERMPLVNGSNYGSKLAALASFNYICGGKEESVKLVVRKENERLELVTKRYPNEQFISPPYIPDSLCRILPGNIAYINLGLLAVAQVDSVMRLVKNCKGLIFDIRYRPKSTFPYILQNLVDQKKPFARFMQHNLDYPGTYLWHKTLPFVEPNAPGKKLFHYTGQVAILVDERTLSHSEFTAMAFQTVQGCVTIGSQTSGADGNIIRASVWPGGIYNSFTGLGVFYPDGSPTQRVGVRIDIEVRPTAKGIREGSDEVLERAIQYIRDKR